MTVCGKIFAALVDVGATHSFLSRKEKRSFGKKDEMGREWIAFKVVNSTMKFVTGVMENT